jgi:hypothetical protein
MGPARDAPTRGFPAKSHIGAYISRGVPAGSRRGVSAMCRNIRTLFNFEPPATQDEVRASALQFVRKLSGFTRPSKGNEAAFNQAIDDVTEAAERLLHSLQTLSPPRDREVEAEKARARAKARYA